MFDNTAHRDYVRTETDYRLDRVRADLAGRRRRRNLTRSVDIGGLTWTKVR
jgi:hypothetical protein